MNRSKNSVVAKLKELDFFKYVDSNEVVENFFKEYQDDGNLNLHQEGLNRVFSIDAEFIYEEEGLYNFAEQILTLFGKFGIYLIIENYVEETESKSTYAKREITINGKKYISPKVFDWASAFSSGIQLVNELITDFKLNEKVFGLFMDETSFLILLTQDQFEYLQYLIPDANPYKPIYINFTTEERMPSPPSPVKGIFVRLLEYFK